MRSFLLFPVGCESKMPVRIQLVPYVSPRSLRLAANTAFVPGFQGKTVQDNPPLELE